MTDHEPVDTAWRIHGAVADWTGKVDAKASFALTIESAVLAGIITLSGSGHRLHGPAGFWPRTMYWVGTSLVILGACLAVLVVAPRLRGGKVSGEAGRNFVYFGHLQHWTPGELEDALQNRDVLPVLTRQLVVMSQIAWTKHIRVKWSLYAASAGSVLVALAALVR